MRDGILNVLRFQQPLCGFVLDSDVLYPAEEGKSFHLAPTDYRLG